jgi:hypothetical protein
MSLASFILLNKVCIIMKQLSTMPYLTIYWIFIGDCYDAMNFYKEYPA